MIRKALMKSSLATEYSLNGLGIRRVLYLGGEPFVVEFSAPREKVLQVEVFGAPSTRQVAEARTVGRRIFALDHPLARMYRMMSPEPALKTICQEYRGLRIIQASSIFEMGATAIIGQQVNMSFAAKIKRELISLWGKRVYLAGRGYVGFPRAQVISHLPAEELRSIQLSQRKAEYLITFAEGVASGELSDDALSKLTDEETRQRLKMYRGIGDWTADMILMRALGRMDVLPSEDIGLRTAYGLVFRCNRPTSKELDRLTSSWTGFRSYATYYLWASLPSGGLPGRKNSFIGSKIPTLTI
jgi:DNA-3-methyladenine glycosylase II